MFISKVKVYVFIYEIDKNDLSSKYYLWWGNK